MGIKKCLRQEVFGGAATKKFAVKGDKIILTFSETGNGLRIGKGEKLEEFVIAGDDKIRLG